MITAISWPTTLTIRHSRFATLTLAKLVASLALHPPVSATEADYAPHHRLRRSFFPRRSLWAAVLSNNLKVDTNDNCTQPASPRHADFNRRRACTARPKGKYSRGRMALAPIRTREFSLPRGRARQVARATPSFIQSAFTSTAQPSLILSWAPRKNRTPYSKYRPPPYSSSRGTDASCTCVSFSATPRNSSFTSESSSGSAIVSDGVRLPPRMRVISVSG